MFTSGELLIITPERVREATESVLARLIMDGDRISLEEIDPVEIDEVIHHLRQYRVLLGNQ